MCRALLEKRWIEANVLDQWDYMLESKDVINWWHFYWKCEELSCLVIFIYYCLFKENENICMNPEVNTNMLQSMMLKAIKEDEELIYLLLYMLLHYLFRVKTWYIPYLHLCYSFSFSFLGVFAKCRYIYYGKHSEGNRFIRNDQLWWTKDINENGWSQEGGRSNPCLIYLSH